MQKRSVQPVPLSARRGQYGLMPAPDMLVGALERKFQNQKPKPDGVALRLLAQQVASNHSVLNPQKLQDVKTLAESAHRSVVPLSYKELQAKVLPHYAQMKDLDKAAERLANAVMNGEQIGISGDYDCDGNCSTALMIRFLTESGVPPQHIHVHIPNRAKEGYGVNSAAVEAMAKRTPPVTFLMTLDNGTTANTPLAVAQDKQMDVAVIDHHPNSEGHALPMRALVVNPRQSEESAAVKDEPNGAPDLAAVGISWLVARWAAELLTERSHYTSKHLSPPDPRQWLGLVAMATIGDVVSLKKPLNHALVSEGLQVIREGGDPYISTLARVAGLREPDIAKLSESDIAFKLAPIINAPGRLGQSVAWAFLSQADGVAEPNVAHLPEAVGSGNQSLKDSIGRMNKHKQGHEKIRINEKTYPTKTHNAVTDLQYRLMMLSDESNDLRKKVGSEVMMQARRQAQEMLRENPNLGTLVLAGDDWHEGVVGIVAGRIKEEFGLPTIVASINRDTGKCKASARNILGGNGDIGQVLRDLCEQDNILSKAGGHPMAAGASFELAKLGDVRKKFEEKMGDTTRQTRAQSRSPIAVAINLGEALGTGRNAQPPLQLLQQFATAQEFLRPHGQGRDKPRVALYGGNLSQMRTTSSSGQHLEFNLGLPGTNETIACKAFHSGGSALETGLRNASQPSTQSLPLLIGTLEQTTRNGQPAVEFFLEDMLMLENAQDQKKVIAGALGATPQQLCSVFQGSAHSR